MQKLTISLTGSALSRPVWSLSFSRILSPPISHSIMGLGLASSTTVISPGSPKVYPNLSSSPWGRGATKKNVDLNVSNRYRFLKKIWVRFA